MKNYNTRGELGDLTSRTVSYWIRKGYWINFPYITGI
jgi:hypothetical protein